MKCFGCGSYDSFVVVPNGFCCGICKMTITHRAIELMRIADELKAEARPVEVTEIWRR